jgi:hypothetical protein
MEDKDIKRRSRLIRVLILSDRLEDQSKALASFLNGTETVEVIGIAEDKQQALDLAGKDNFDYLLIAGYLKKEYNYEVIEDLQRRGKKFLTVQWSILDPLIAEFCRRYKIPLKFERTLPMAEFVIFLEEHRHDLLENNMI